VEGIQPLRPAESDARQLALTLDQRMFELDPHGVTPETRIVSRILAMRRLAPPQASNRHRRGAIWDKHKEKRRWDGPSAADAMRSSSV
jgi:hypothetical protein